MTQIVEVTRTYGGAEGYRVKAGTKFSVGHKAKLNGEDLQVISDGRYRQLLKAELVRTYAADNVPLAQTPRPCYEGQAAKTVTVKQPITTQKRADAQVREAAPSEPRPLKNPASPDGGKTGAKTLSSSSPVAPQSKPSDSKPRGNRSAKPSVLTTHTKSVPGPKPSTPATGNGGVSTKDAKNSKD